MLQFKVGMPTLNKVKNITANGYQDAAFKAVLAHKRANKGFSVKENGIIVNVQKVCDEQIVDCLVTFNALGNCAVKIIDLKE